jgi:hypothetical protein
MLIGATNFFNEKTDSVKNQLTGEYGVFLQRNVHTKLLALELL